MASKCKQKSPRHIFFFFSFPFPFPFPFASLSLSLHFLHCALAQYTCRLSIYNTDYNLFTFSSPFTSHPSSVMDLLSGTDASGRQISLLNVNKQRANSYGSNPSSVDGDSPSPGAGQMMSSSSPYSSDNDMKGHQPQQQVNTKRKYHCREPGCDKSFTTR